MFNSNDFKVYLGSIHGCSACNIGYSSEMKLNKTHRETKEKWIDKFGELKVIKVSNMNSNIGYDYEGVLKKRLISEGKIEDAEHFESNKLPWGEWSIPKYLIGHKGEDYLRVYRNEGVTSKYDRAEYTWSDGRSISEDEWKVIEGYMPPKKDYEKVRKIY